MLASSSRWDDEKVAITKGELVDVLEALDQLTEIAEGTVAEILGQDAIAIVARRLFGRELPE